MFDISVEQNEKNYTVFLKGRLDTNGAPLANEQIAKIAKNAQSIVLDFSELVYLSSAGIRVINVLYQSKADDCRLVLRNVNADIMDIFELVGLDSVFDFE